MHAIKIGNRMIYYPSMEKTLYNNQPLSQNIKPMCKAYKNRTNCGVLDLDQAVHNVLKDLVL